MSKEKYNFEQNGKKYCDKRCHYYKHFNYPGLKSHYCKLYETSLLENKDKNLIFCYHECIGINIQDYLKLVGEI